MPEVDQNFRNAARTVNQFIDLAGRDDALQVRNNGNVATKSNSIWNKLVSYFRSGPTQRNNQRTAEIFKEKLLTVAGTYEYKSGNESYHSKDIFHHFAGFDSSDRARAIETVLNSGILNDELNGTRPLTGRKVQEVLSQIKEKGIEFASTQHREILGKVEEGIGLYRETRHKFQEGFFDPEKLEASNVDAFNIAQEDLRNVSFKLEGLITNIRQDIQTAIEIDDLPLSRELFRQLQHVATLKSEAALFNAESKVYNILNTQVNPLVPTFEAAIQHLDAITYNFANLTEEQAKARDDLQKIANDLSQPLGLLGNSIKNATYHLEHKELLNADQIKKWEELKQFCEDKVEEIKSARARAAQAVVIKTTATGIIKSIEPRSEENHIAPTELITKAELDGLEKEIVRLEEAHKTGVSKEPKKGILGKKVSAEAINQIRQGRSVQHSSSIALSRGELEGAAEVRKSVPKGKGGNEDLSELHEADDSFGVFDQASNTLRRDSFSNLARADRLSDAKGSAARAALGNQQTRDFEASQATLQTVKDLTAKYVLNSEHVRTLAQESNIDLAKFSPNHQELYQTILFHQAKALATDNPKAFNEAGIQKLSQRILTHLNTLSETQAQESVNRLNDLREAGKVLLASIADGEIKGLTERRQPLATALISFAEKVNSNEILHDLVSRKPGDAVGGYEFGAAKIAIADIAFSGIKGATLELLFNDALKEDSPLRNAYKAVGAHNNNSELDTNDGLNAAVLELTQGLNLVVQQIGIGAGLGNDAIKDAVDSYDRTYGAEKYQDYSPSNQNPNPQVPPSAQEIFGTLTPYLNQRVDIINQRARTQ